MNFSEARKTACELSEQWAIRVWMFFIKDGPFYHIVGRDYKQLQQYGKRNGGSTVVGKAENGTFTRYKTRPKVLATFESRSKPEVVYYVTRDTDHKLQCSCPGWLYRSKCWHMTKYKEK